jgi:hypothetical protein
MNPLSLLTKGKSFGGVKDRTGAYKLPSRSALPNFATPKRPAPTMPHPAPKPSQTALFEQPRPAVVAAVPAKRDGAAPIMPIAPATPPAMESIWHRAARCWAEFLARRTKPAIPRFPASTVQVELALEKVTVVRNDLTEDDLEVVTVNTGAPPEKRPRKPAEKVELETQLASP